MPLYDYSCKECQHSFSQILRVDDRELPIQSSCPNCNHENCIQMNIGAPAVIDPFRLGIRKPDSAFKERMNQIKANHKHMKHNIKD